MKIEPKIWARIQVVVLKNYGDILSLNDARWNYVARLKNSKHTGAMRK